ncbi:hypothetical protein [uncultured Microscilla sp.]|uniref:hypothetical protein n=1 Tax=uncultured Microscilla sp. TaxID=432653 RepID=UPI00262684C6|nr:hypothetical protein [uncultured Microscilla sp.]
MNTLNSFLNKLPIAFYTLFTFTLSSCGGDRTYQTKTIENRYSISISRGMKQYTNHSNTIAMLYRDKERGECIAVTDHLKESGKALLTSHLQTLADNPELLGVSIKNARFGKPFAKQINGHNAIQAGMSALIKLDDQWESVWGIVAYIEGKTHIYQITTWLADDEPGEDDARLHDMINSFEELKEEEY